MKPILMSLLKILSENSPLLHSNECHTLVDSQQQSCSLKQKNKDDDNSHDRCAISIAIKIIGDQRG
jgi:hypothetical protein